MTVRLGDSQVLLSRLGEWWCVWIIEVSEYRLQLLPPLTVVVKFSGDGEGGQRAVRQCARDRRCVAGLVGGSIFPKFYNLGCARLVGIFPVRCSANVGSVVLLRRFPRSDRCPPMERRTYVGEPLRRLAPDTTAKPSMRQKRFGCGRSPR